MEWKEYLMRCDCHDARHLAIVEYLDYENVFFTVHLSTYQNFFKRIATAVKYVFGKRSDYGEYDEIVLRPRQVKSLIDFLQGFLDRGK